MDKREKRFQSVNICHRLYHLMKFLARHAHKRVISGSPMPRRLAQTPAISNEASSKSVQQVHPMVQTATPHEGQQAKTSSNDQEKGSKHASEIQDIGASNTAHSEENKKSEEEATLPSNYSQPKAPKKMVSINENVETINTSKRKKNKKKKEQAMLDEPKPLKSILKVTSDVNNTIDSQSHSLLSHANGA